MTDTLLQILQWAVPSGGIGAAIAWLANRKVKSAEQAKAVHDTYKVMYEDVSALLEQNQKKYGELTEAMDTLATENDKTRRALNRLTRAIEAIKVCPHRATCPVSGELSLDEGNEQRADRDERNDAPKRQRKSRNGGSAKQRGKEREQRSGHGGDVDLGRDDEPGRYIASGDEGKDDEREEE